ncbi:hypothetical protein V6N11_082088 [Hibiscus sabdariffa]|uniref:Uncharacterized protein n=1 Tax=Hibiscus sabdariffa TaxID=183260 RepID=A0ABR2QGW6_9ROSI
MAMHVSFFKKHVNWSMRQVGPATRVGQRRTNSVLIGSRQRGGPAIEGPGGQVARGRRLNRAPDNQSVSHKRAQKPHSPDSPDCGLIQRRKPIMGHNFLMTPAQEEVIEEKNNPNRTRNYPRSGIPQSTIQMDYSVVGQTRVSTNVS